MNNILVIHSSVRFSDSISRSLSAKLVNRLNASADNRIERDLSRGIPYINHKYLDALNRPSSDLSSDEQQLVDLSNELIFELEWADTIVIGSPMYNFGPSASLKAWADLVARAGVTFQYSDKGPQGLLKNKKAYIIAVTGGTIVNSHNDYMTPWLKHFLKFIGIKNISTIIADGVYADNGENKIGQAEKTIYEVTDVSS